MLWGRGKGQKYHNTAISETSQILVDWKIMFGPFSVNLHVYLVMFKLAFEKAHVSSTEQGAERLGLTLISVYPPLWRVSYCKEGFKFCFWYLANLTIPLF